ncbi:hypothetical protein M8J76_001745 [Diaphorina citri]|nr:hypothetical protein M8J76_001745 [Diaphorina citri]KAI5742813.1 hypothetical protein M8J77_011553 [Diaphorina citri]
MIVGILTQRVVSCFCRTCRYQQCSAAVQYERVEINDIIKPNPKPVVSKSASGTKYQKKPKIMTTEIRCEEKSKGGIKYDVILAEPAGTPPPLKTAADTPVILRSESIEEKLKQAEERRLSLEAEKIAKNAARRSKIEDAAKKRDEKENEFIEQTKETLEKRLEISSEKREALINDKMEKLKDHDRRVEEARLKKEKLEDSKENGCEETTPSG